MFILFVCTTDEESQGERMKRQKDMHKASRVMILHMRFGNYPIDINRDGEFGWQEEMPNIVTRTHIHYIK